MDLLLFLITLLIFEFIKSNKDKGVFNEFFFLLFLFLSVFNEFNDKLFILGFLLILSLLFFSL